MHEEMKVEKKNGNNIGNLKVHSFMFLSNFFLFMVFFLKNIFFLNYEYYYNWKLNTYNKVLAQYVLLRKLVFDKSQRVRINGSRTINM